MRLLGILALLATATTAVACAPEDSEQLGVSQERLTLKRLSDGNLVYDPSVVPDEPYYFEKGKDLDPEVGVDEVPEESTGGGVQMQGGTPTGSVTDWNVDLSDRLGPARNQGQNGTCFSFAFTAACETLRGDKQSLSVEPVRDRLQLLGADGLFSVIAASRVRGTNLVVEKDWPYDGDKRSGAKTVGKLATVEQFDTSPYLVKKSLEAGVPVVVGICWDNDFAFGAKHNQLRITGAPSTFGRRISCNIRGKAGADAGGHALLLVGYSVNSEGRTVFKFRNSWGDQWGDAGYGTMGDGFLKNMGMMAFSVGIKG